MTTKKKPAKKTVTRTEDWWMVWSPEIGLYPASNYKTEKFAKDRHQLDTSEHWKDRRNKGDRAIRVKITYNLSK